MHLNLHANVQLLPILICFENIFSDEHKRDEPTGTLYVYKNQRANINQIVVTQNIHVP